MSSGRSTDGSDQQADADVTATLNVTAERERLEEIMAWTEAQKAVTGPFHMRLQLVVEELFLNVVTHGYPEGPGPVRLFLGPIAEGLVLAIEDEGPAYNPLVESPVPDLDTDIEDRAIGGLGVHLVRSMTTKQDYQRIDDCNRLTLVFANLDKDSPPPAPDEDPDLKEPKQSFRETQARPRLILPLLLRVVSPIGVVLAASLMLAAVLNLLKLEHAFQDVAKIRYDSTVRELRDTIERSFGAGLSLQSNNATKIALDRTAGLHDQKIFLYASDETGAVVHWSSNGAEALIATELEPHLGPSAEEITYALWDGMFLTSTPLVVEDSPIGTLTLAFPAEQLADQALDLRAHMVLLASIAVLAVLPILAVFAAIGFLPVESRLLRLSRDMRALAEGRLAPPSRWHEDPLLVAARDLVQSMKLSHKDSSL